MKTILQSIQNKLSEIKELQYIDQDWGQLNDYAPNIPVKWPCALIDTQSGTFFNLSKDFTKTPKDRQIGRFNVEITIANLKLTNTSFLTPQKQKNDAWEIYSLIEKVHAQLHGFSPNDNCSKMLRSSFQKTQRDDGVLQYTIIYQFEIHNI